MQSPFRRSLLWVHTWVGLTAGMVMIFLAVTGAVLVVRPYIEVPLNRHMLEVPACAVSMPLDALVKSAKAAHPDSKLDSVEVDADATRSVAVMFKNKDYVYVDPCSGVVLGTQNQYGGFLGVVDYLHRFRFMVNGRAVAGGIDVLLAVFIVIGGVVLWWPRTRAAIKAAFTYNWRLPGIASTISLHKFLGIYAAALLLILTVTGVPIAFPWAKDAIAWITQSSAEAPPPPKVAPTPGKPLKMDAIYAAVKAAMPDATWTAISFPGKKTPTVYVELLERGVPHSEAKSYLYLDAVTGQVLQATHYKTGLSLGRKVYLYILAIHRGLIGGIFYQTPLLLACLFVPIQFYSGLSPYIRKSLRKSRRGKEPISARLRLKLVARRVEAQDIVSLEFAAADGGALPAFSAGSHIDLFIRPGLTRQYSLCNDSNETHRYLIAVLLTPDSRGGSTAMHALEIGDIIESGGPKNHFPLVDGAASSLLIAGGIGITPILCMVERLSQTEAAFSLHFAVRSRARLAFQDRIASSSFANRTSFHIDNEGTALDVCGLLARTDSASHIYVCGPGRLIEAVTVAARDLGWPEDRVHYEYFQAAQHEAGADTAFDVKIASTGEVVHVAVGQSVTDALAGKGILIPTSCSEGVCGTCITGVLSGEVDHRDVVLSPADHASNARFTPCCSRARGPLLVLDI